MAATFTRTWPAPLPVAPLAIDAQEESLAAVQLHAPAATAIVIVPPAEAIDCDVGDNVTLHAAVAAAAWVTVTVCPATVTVPDRATPVFAAAVIVAAPGPFVPADTDNHDAPLDVVQLHPPIVDT